MYPSALVWWLIIVNGVFILWGLSALLGSHVAGLRGHDRLDGFKTGLLFGVVGVAFLTFKKDAIPDVQVVCPHCKTRQDVGGDLGWYECWKCEKTSDVPQSAA